MSKYQFGSIVDRKFRLELQRMADYISGMGYTYEESLQMAEEILEEAKKINIKNIDVQQQVDDIIADLKEEGVSVPEVIQARGSHNLLYERLNAEEYRTKKASLKSDLSSPFATRRISDLQSIVTFIDDDGYDAVIDQLKPMFTSRGVPMCSALTGESQVLSTEEKRETLRDLQDNYGWEFMSHTMTHIHLDASTDQELEEDSSNFLNLMNEYGLNVQSIVYPWGERGNTSVLSKYYVSGFSTTPGKNDIELDDYGIRREALGDNGYSLQYYKDLIDSAVGKNEWIVFMTHIADPDTDAQLIEDVLDYAISKLPIVTARDGLKLYGSLFNSRENSSVDTRYFRVKSNGLVQTNKYLMNYREVGNNGVEITGDTLPSEFDVGVTSKTFNVSAAGTLPTEGTLVTTKTANINGFSSQMLYMQGSLNKFPEVYFRHSDISSDAWAPWVTLTGKIDNKSETDLLDAYPYGESISLVTGWSLGNGVVKTTKVSSTNGFARQIFYKAASNATHTRSQNTDGGWTDWSQIQMV